MGLIKTPFTPYNKKGEVKNVKPFKKNELEFLSSWYPIPCEDPNRPIQFFFTPLNVLTETEFDSLLKLSDITPIPNVDSDANFKVFRSIFVKEEKPAFKERLLSYKTKDQTKLNNFSFTELIKTRDKKYLKETKGVNFITGIGLDSTGKDVIIKNLSSDALVKQIKNSTLEGKKYTSSRYDTYISLLRSQFEKNPDKIIPLQEGKIINDPFFVTTLSQLQSFLLPGLKAHKIAEFIYTVKTNLSVKEFKKSKSFGRIYELRGEAIRYFYNEKNYTKLEKNRGSVLYNSCMRHNSCYEQLKFYSNNPESIAMLVVMDKENPRQISARTILWSLIDGDKATDRIYNNNQDDTNVLITYAKSMGYKTVFSGTSDSYGMPYVKRCVVHIEDPEDTGLPYFDTMHCWERVNSFLSRDSSELKSYCNEKKLDYALVDSGGFYSPRLSSFSIKGNSSIDYIKDIYGKDITDKGRIIAIDLPHKGYLNNEQVQLIGYPKRTVFRASNQFIKELKKKYNCVMTAICRWEPDKYTPYIDDKKNLVYSTVLKSYIDKRDSYFDETVKAFIYKGSWIDRRVREVWRLRKICTVYSRKIVSLTEEGYEYFKKLNESMVVPLGIIKIRPSRKFKVCPQNVTIDGVILQDIVVPFKYLKTIKRNE